MAEETNCDVESKAAQQGVVSMFVELFPGSNSYCVRLRWGPNVYRKILCQMENTFVSNGNIFFIELKLNLREGDLLG